VVTRSIPPHPNPLPPGERVGHSSPQQSWGVFWHILIKGISMKVTHIEVSNWIEAKEALQEYKDD
jgi:hypothetical protein